MVGWFRQYQTALFFVLTLVIPISTLVLAGALDVPKNSVGEQVLEVVAKYGPSLAGIIVSAIVGGAIGITTLLRRYLIWRVKIRWYLLALILPLLCDDLLPLVLYKLFGGGATIDYSFSFSSAYLFLPVMAQYFFFGGGMGEEFGWRGYLTPHLQSQNSPLRAALLVGCLWAAWHFPLFWMGHHNGGELVYLHLEKVLRACALSVSFAWIFNSTRGSVLLAALMHATTNAWGQTYSLTPDAAGGFLHSQRILDLLAIGCWVAMAVVLVMRGKLKTAG